MPGWVDGPGGPFGSWGAAEPAIAQWRPGRPVVAAAAVVMVLLLVAAWVLGMRNGPDGVDWSDPAAVGAGFVRRYAVHDPAACELVTSALRSRLDAEGRCAGPTRGVAPRLGVFASVTCGGVHSFDVVVAPQGEFGRRFVSVGLERAELVWRVRSVVPIGDCRVMAPPACGGGG